jgi:phosphoribosylglycinamide formyltransferase-1
MSKINIAIFASGNGTNAEAIIKHFRNSKIAKVALILSNNKDAYVLERARKHGIPSVTFTRKEFYDSTFVDEQLKKHGIDFIVLAGFMWLVPARLVDAYENRMVNIHPALLPKYGGKGMYGMHVHEAVVKNREKESGITIHWVNKVYDDGHIIFQGKCTVDPDDTAEDVAAKVHQLEYAHYPVVIEEQIRKLI